MAAVPPPAELGADRNLDIPVKFAGHARYDNYLGLRATLERLIGRRLDLVTETGLQPRARASV